MQTQQESPPSGRHSVKDVLTELETLRDEIRVRIHLAGMEAKDSWNELEPRLTALEAQAKDARDQATHAVKETATELVASLKKLRDRL